MFKLMISLGCVSTVLLAYLSSPCSNAIYHSIVPLVGKSTIFYDRLESVLCKFNCISLECAHSEVEGFPKLCGTEPESLNFS